MDSLSRRMPTLKDVPVLRQGSLDRALFPIASDAYHEATSFRSRPLAKGARIGRAGARNLSAWLAGMTEIEL